METETAMDLAPEMMDNCVHVCMWHVCVCVCVCVLCEGGREEWRGSQVKFSMTFSLVLVAARKPLFINRRCNNGGKIILPKPKEGDKLTTITAIITTITTTTITITATIPITTCRVSTCSGSPPHQAVLLRGSQTPVQR